MAHEADRHAHALDKIQRWSELVVGLEEYMQNQVDGGLLKQSNPMGGEALAMPTWEER